MLVADKGTKACSKSYSSPQYSTQVIYASDGLPSAVSGTSLIRGLRVYGAVEEVDLQFGFDNGIVLSKRNLTSNPKPGTFSEDRQR